MHDARTNQHSDPQKRHPLAVAVAENFVATVRLWGQLPSSRMEEHDSCIFVSTGVPIPDQNYACSAAEGYAEDLVPRSVHFFRKERVPFTWWIPPASRSEKLHRVLEKCGLPLRCSPPAMALSLATHADGAPPASPYTVCGADTPKEACVWARCSLEGFGSGPKHEVRFAAFSTALVTPLFADFFRLLTLSVEGVPATTTLLSLTGVSAGIYYFSTVPAFRKRGLGRLLLGETLREARRSGCHTVTLQASPMGFPLYKSFGFVECGRFAVHSGDPDAC